MRFPIRPAAALASLAAAASLALPAGAADPAQGRALAGACRVCHGLDGQGTAPNIPNIGGQSAEYLTRQLQDFREGRRADAQMSIIASNLSDDEIADLAAWYASIEVTVTMPE